MFKGCNEILGLFLDDSKLETMCLKKQGGKWRTASLPKPLGESPRSPQEQLRGLLKTIHPAKRRRICLGLSRKLFFLREIDFPQLSPEDATESVRMSIGLHVHLKPEEIYFDQWAFVRDGHTKVLLAYVPRSVLEPLFEIIKDTGHNKSELYACPASLGLDIFLRESAHASFPSLSVGIQGKDMVVSLHGTECWEGSHLLDTGNPGDVAGKLLELSDYLPRPFREHARSPDFFIGFSEKDALELRSKDPCRLLRDMEYLCHSVKGFNWGLATACLGLSSYPEISFQEEPRKRPFRLKISMFQMAAALTAAVILWTTGGLVLETVKASRILKQQEIQIQALDKRIEPLRISQKRLEEIEKQINDLNDFKSEYPSALSILKELAELTPDNTWIKSLRLRKNKLRISAEGASAVETMARWRKSPLFSNVKLISPVTKDRYQRERFSVEILIKSIGGTDK